MLTSWLMNIWLILFPAAISFLILFLAGMLHRAEFFYKRGWHTDVLLGAAWFILARFIMIWMEKISAFPSHGVGLYLQQLLSFMLPFWYFAYAGFLLVKHFKGSDHSSSAFISGYGVFAGLAVTIGLSHPVDPYILFIFPVLAGASIFYLIELHRLIKTSIGTVFGFSVCGVIAGPFVVSFVPFLYYRNLILFAMLLALVISVPSFILIYNKVSEKL